jgi:Cdc6-like AAA superfamily ATPase
VLTKDTNFSEWWADQTEKLSQGKTSSQNSDNDLFKYLLFSQHAHKEPVSKAELANKLHSTFTSKIGNKKNIILWNKEQLTISQNKDAKQLIISGPFGSGKTVLLKEKAKELATMLKKKKSLAEKNGAVQNLAFESVHFLTLRQVHADASFQLQNKTSSNLQSLILEKELEKFGIKVVFFWTLLELFEYIDEHSLSDHFFLDEFSLFGFSKVMKQYWL